MLATILNTVIGLQVCLSDPGRNRGLDTTLQNVRDHVIGKSCGGIQVSGLHETMMGERVVFCVIVSKVDATRFSVDKELALDFTIFYPGEVNVNHLGSLLLDGIVGEPFCC